MDREILFRAKRADGNGYDGEWIYGYGATGDQIIHLDIYAGFIGVKVAPSTVGRYTGLTDKTGKKIFEGDIVAAGYYKWKCQVVWDEECARFICYTFERERRIVYVDMTDKDGKSALEVIGNVHDNPALMGGDGDG